MSAAINASHEEFDPLLRGLHWFNGLALTMLLFSGVAVWRGNAGGALMQLHVLTGYALLLGFVLRVLWGVVGPQSACWTDLWRPAAGRAASDGPGLSAPAGRWYLGGYFVAASLLLSGLWLESCELESGLLHGIVPVDGVYDDLMVMPHRIGALAALVLLLLHLRYVFVRRGKLASMVTGRRNRPSARPGR